MRQQYPVTPSPCVPECLTAQLSRKALLVLPSLHPPTALLRWLADMHCASWMEQRKSVAVQARQSRNGLRKLKSTTGLMKGDESPRIPPNGACRLEGLLGLLRWAGFTEEWWQRAEVFFQQTQNARRTLQPRSQGPFTGSKWILAGAVKFMFFGDCPVQRQNVQVILFVTSPPLLSAIKFAC